MARRSGQVVIGASVVLGIAAIAVDDAIVSAGLVDLAAAVAVTGVFVGARRRPRGARTAWTLLGIALALWLVGDLCWDWFTIRNAEPPTVSVADIAYLAGYPVMVLATWRMLRMRSPRNNRDAVLDGMTLALAGAMLAWHTLVLPAAYEGMPGTEQFVAAAYPFGDVLLLTALSWIAFAPGRRSAPTWLLYGFCGSTLLLDIVYTVVPRIDATMSLDVVNALYPVSYSLLAAAALHPSVDELTTPVVEQITRLHPSRLAFLVLAVVTRPAIDTLAHFNAGTRELFSVAVGLLVTTVVLVRFVAVVRDRESAREELEFQASHDVLTGLLNRHLLTDRIAHAIAGNERDVTHVGVLYVDLDRFKAVNDTLGHEAGDAVLVETARRLEGSVRAGDTVARLGGDEFAVLCERLDDAAALVAVADRIVESLGRPFDLREGTAVVSASVGIVLANVDPGADSDTLLRDADAAMYRAKDAGRNRWEVFDDEMRGWLAERRDLESALARAVERGELRLLYQPVIDLAANEVVGFEALVRWERPGHGLVPPLDFIPLAEETGLILPIGEWVLDEACRQVAVWNDTFVDRAPVHMSVNVSGRQLNQANLRSCVERAVQRAGIDPSWLTLELTESILLDDADWALTQLESVKRLGVRVAIDDFGTGYSALAYLRQFPIDIVKIDRSFISDLGALDSGTTVVAAVIALSHALGHVVVAEGVETVDQLRTLRGLGCDSAQGYLFAKPLPTATATALLRSRAPIAMLIGHVDPAIPLRDAS